MKKFRTAMVAAVGLALIGAGSAWADSHNRRSDLQPADEAKPAAKNTSAQTTAKKQNIVVADSHNRRKPKKKDD